MSKHLIIGVPAYAGTVKLATFKALLTDCTTLAIGGWDIEIVDTISGAEIDTIRNKLISYLASHEKASDLIMVDHDVTWSHNDLLRLLAVPLDGNPSIVGGVYPKRMDPIEYPFMPLMDDNMQPLYDPDLHMMRCEHIPGGFMRIPKFTAQSIIDAGIVKPYAQVFNKIEPKGYTCYSFCEKIWQYNEATGENHRLSEDISFCKRVLEAGGEVYAHPDIPMAHIGDKMWCGSKLRGNSARHSDTGFAPGGDHSLGGSSTGEAVE